MDDVVLIVCGGGAFSVYRNTRDKVPVPTVVIDSNTDNSSIILSSEKTDDCRGNPNLAGSLIRDNIDSVREVVLGKRIVVIYSVLGGGAGTGMMPEIVSCANGCGCRTVSVVGLPWSIEAGKREKAMDILPEIVRMSDRTFIMDLDVMVRLHPNVKANNSLEMHSRTLAFAFSNLLMLMDGPFFSTFSQKAYTFAYASDLDPLTATAKAMESSMVETDPSIGKLILFVGAGFGTAESESITQKIVSMSGILPEIIKREDHEDTKLLMFLSVKAH